MDSLKLRNTLVLAMLLLFMLMGANGQEEGAPAVTSSTTSLTASLFTYLVVFIPAAIMYLLGFKS